MVFLILSICSYLVPLYTGLSKKESLLWKYGLTGFLFDVFVTLSKRVFHIQYGITTNIFVLVEFLIITRIYKKVLFRKDTHFRVFCLAMSLAFITHGVYNKLTELNTFGYCVFLFLYIIYTIMGFYSILQKKEVVFIEKSALFWTNVAFIIYASGDFICILFTNYMRSNVPDLYIFLWMISFKIFNILKNLFLAKALSCEHNESS